MIEFRGEISGQCKKFILKRECKIGLISGSITAVIFAIPMIILTFTAHWAFIISLPALAIMAMLAGMPPNKNSYDLIIPSSVLINPEERTIISQSSKFYYIQSIDEIKRIIDYGEWYHILFNNKNGRFICQKDLICLGTIEDFEQLFDGKVIKK